MPRPHLYLPMLSLAACVQVPEDALEPFALDSDAAVHFAAIETEGRPPTAPPYTGPECETVHGDTPMRAVEDGDAPVLMGDPLAGDGAPGDSDAGGSPDGSAGGAAGGDGSAESPRMPNSAGDVIITELMTDPVALSDGMGEWIELHNPGEDRLDLGECVLLDGDQRRALPTGLVIEPGAYVVLARADAPGVAPVALVAFTLNNGGDRIALHCGGVDIDVVGYGADHPLTPGASLALSGDAIDHVLNDDAAAWCASEEIYAGDRGTPGAPNPPCTAAEGADDAGDTDGGV